MEGSLEHELKTWSWEPSQIGLGLVLFCLPLMIFFLVEVDAAQVEESSQISFYRCLLDGGPKNQHEGVAFFAGSSATLC